MSQGNRKGMTLIELMVSMSILVVVVAMTTTIVIQGVNVSRRGHEITDANEAARMGGEALTSALQSAGLGMSGGVYVAHGAVVVRTSPVIIVNSTTGPDELWVVRTHRQALLESCVDEGAATTVQRSGFGAIFARCSGGLTTAGLSGGGLTAAQNILMATNMSSGALLTNPVFTASPPGVSLGFDESGVANFADHPQRGFQKGDLVMPVRLEHYFIAPFNGVPSLMMEPGRVGSVSQGFAPTGTPRLIQLGVEDMQFAIGSDPTFSGDPAQITWANGPLGPNFVPGLKAVRVSLMTRSLRTLRASNGTVLLTNETSPQNLEDHVIPLPVVPDGFRRTLYTRRVELVNLGAENL
ncbi:MAG: prepilin-type N-terminal cleavage/methylation domain-containing protein [Archangium sp.]|nr:prepilin-type N-terminal cleavage/methylation domain-containing protein [Archangium sp.]